MRAKLKTQDFLLDRGTIKYVEIIRRKHIKKFTLTIEDEDRFTGMMAMVTYPLLIEIEDFYNNELLINYSIFEAIKTKNKVDRRVISYHIENVLMRIVSLWDYIYQLLNHHFQLKLIDRPSREKLIIRCSHEPTFHETESGTTIQWIEKSAEEQVKIKKEIKKIKDVNKKNVLDTMYQTYEVIGRIEILMQSIINNEINTIKEIRNQITHQRPAGANFSVDYSDIFGDYVISGNQTGWIDLKDVSNKIDNGLHRLSETIQIIHEIIHLDEYPNRIENAGKRFYLIRAICNNCNREFTLPSELFGDDNLFSDHVLCPHCWEYGCTVIAKAPTNEVNYGTSFGAYIERFNEQMANGNYEK